MPSRLVRLHSSGQTHFITFSCWHNRRFFTDPSARHTFEAGLERIRRRFQLCVYGYVVMPDHIHLLLSEPHRGTLAEAIKSLKQGVARRLINGCPTQASFACVGEKAIHFWQKRYYDFNLRTHSQFVEKLRYIHRNPVKRELCARPEDWQWSSFRHYATGREGPVEIESEWTARKRERAAGRLCPAIHIPTQAKEA